MLDETNRHKYLKMNLDKSHKFTAVTKVYRAQTMGEWKIISSTKTLYIKFSGKMYYRKVPEISNCS